MKRPFHDVPPFLQAAVSPAKRRVALVVGNGAYTSAPTLRNPTKDARKIGEVLARHGFHVIEGHDLGRDAMEDKLGEFEAAIAASEAALLFFSGHGLQVEGHNYLTPVDADIRQEVHLKRRAFRVDEVLDIMVRRARSRELAPQFRTVR